MRQDATTTERSPAASALRAPAITAPAAPARPARIRAAVRRVRRGLPPAAGLGLLAAIASAVVLRDPFVTGDTVYHLIWGRELAHGALDSFAGGPTPHPLVLAAATATSVLGAQASYDVTWLLFGPGALGAVVAALFCVGSQVGNRWTGTLAALTLAVTVPVFTWTAAARYDVAFGALVLWALAAHLARPRRPIPVLVLLALAGLIRPEAWLISGLYWLWAARSLEWPQRLLTAGIVGFAPACWMAMDAAVMGDFLYSLHFTERASQVLTDRYTPAQHLGQSAGDLARIAGWLTVPAALLLLLRPGRWRRPVMRPMLALLGVLLAVFALLLLDGMPNERYLIVPGWLLIALAALAATPEPGKRSAVVIGAAALLVLQAIVYWQSPLLVRKSYRLPVVAVADLKSLVARPDVSRMMSTCPNVAVTAYRESWSYWAGRPPGAITIQDRPERPPDVYVVPNTRRAAERLLTRRGYDDDPTFTVPAGMRPGPIAGTWRLYLNPRSSCVTTAS